MKTIERPQTEVPAKPGEQESVESDAGNPAIQQTQHLLEDLTSYCDEIRAADLQYIKTNFNFQRYLR